MLTDSAEKAASSNNRVPKLETTLILFLVPVRDKKINEPKIRPSLLEICQKTTHLP